MFIQRRILIVGAMSAVLLGGCGDSRVAGPVEGGFDMAAAETANATIGALIDGPGMTGLAALGPRMPAVFAGGSEVRGALRSVPGLPGLALRLLQSVPTPDGPLTVPVMRPAVLGRTYVYSAAEHRYVPDPSRTGAPANGARFILYQVDPVSHEPIAGQETGYADLTDEGAGTGLGVALRLRAVADGKTFLDYAFSLTPTFAGGLLRVSGFLSDGQNRLDFSIGAAGQAIWTNQAVRVTFELDLAAQRFHANGSIEALASGTAGTARVEVAVTIGSDAIQLSGESTAASVNAGLSVNGRLFATITGNPRHPTIRGDGGRELSAAELQVLGGLVGVVYGAIEMLEHLLEPVAVLLGISIWL